MKNKLSTIVQIIIYKMNGDELVFLLLKRNKDKGGFWTAVNGTLEQDESIEECRVRELFEETQIKKVLNWSHQIYKFNFEYRERIMTVLVFSAQVDKDQEIIINEEHTEYKWLNFTEALELLKFDDDKKALQICNDIIDSSK